MPEMGPMSDNRTAAVQVQQRSAARPAHRTCGESECDVSTLGVQAYFWQVFGLLSRISLASRLLAISALQPLPR